MVLADGSPARPLTETLRDMSHWAGTAITEFSDLGSFYKRQSTDSGIISIRARDVILDVMLVNRKSATTVVSFHGAITDRDRIKLPAFNGLKLAGDTPNVILISDPSLYLHPDLKLAWYSGSENFSIQNILPSLIGNLNSAIGAERLIFTGASGGGFASLYYSHFFPNSLSIPIVPQTDLSKFVRHSVVMYALACFGAKTDIEIRDVLENRITSDLTQLYGAGYSNHIVYCQNSSDDHVTLHEEPFFASLPKQTNGRIALVHGSWGDGHIVPPFALWRKLVTDAVNWSGDWSQFVDTFDFSYLGDVRR